MTPPPYTNRQSMKRQIEERSHSRGDDNQGTISSDMKFGQGTSLSPKRPVVWSATLSYQKDNEKQKEHDKCLKKRKT